MKDYLRKAVAFIPGDDCFGICAERILDALSDEAKNPEKQKSGKSGQKKRNFAAVSAAPEGRTANIIPDRFIGNVKENTKLPLIESSRKTLSKSMLQ
jgi:hypothetical protein